MLELRPSCEHCDKSLPSDSREAMICTYECTFCESCVNEILENVCPNCGGGFQKRPIRPKDGLDRHPASVTKVHKPVSENQYLDKNKNIAPHLR